jgi:hypothetical protein
VVARRHGGREARGAGANDHDVSRKIPFHPGIALGGGALGGGLLAPAAS